MRGSVLAMVALALAVACGGKTVVTPLPGWTFPGPHGTTEQHIDKVDLLFAIDGSASMGDAQGLLAQAVPVLVNRLMAPNCVDATGIACTNAAQCSSLGPGAQCELSAGSGRCWVPSSGGACPAGTKQEFPPVHDLHIGIVSSSLGGGGSPDVCVTTANDPSHQDDEGHLLNRTKPANAGGPEGAISNAKPLDGTGGNFLAWLPMSNPSNAGKTLPNVTAYGDGQQAQLLTDFQSLVTGVQNHGCGLQAPLESWYRFLVQPDPYDSIVVGSGAVPPAKLEGVDATLLKMRHDFLRPDSLVAIVQLTGRDERWSDPLWGGGYGWTARTQNFPGGLGQGVGPRGTSECDAPVDPNKVANTGPNNPDCTSCAFTGSKPVSGQPIASDPNCLSCAAGASCPQKGWYTPQQDGLNVRYTDDMKRRYGLDPQWSVQRYVDGLTLGRVPDRDNETHGPDYGTTVPNCTNPLFAQNLPDGSDTSHDALCNLQPGSRTPDLVFYALIGGVPNELLYDPSGNFKPNLGTADWTRILGKAPSTYQLDGIDPHMIESIGPRPGLQTPGASYTLGTDPDHGREWNTLTSPAGIDLQYACTYPLPVARDCTQPQNAGACDCVATATSAPDGPPLCDPANRNMQIRGKAYPTIRELRVAEGLGKQAVVASLCARDTNPADAALPAYGYNPAMQGIVNRLRTTLGGECLAATLPVTAAGTSSCVVLVVFTAQTDQASGCTLPGYTQPPADLLQLFQQQWAAQQGNVNAPVPVLCQLQQLAAGTDYAPPSCDLAPTNPPGWCYVQNDPVSGCSAEVRFSPQGEPPAGTSVTLACPTTP
jgi:hypothetical protein